MSASRAVAPSGERQPPRMMAITAPDAPLGPALDLWLATLGVAGIDALQVRRKELPDRDLLVLVRRCRAALPPGVAVLVNGRVDVAVAAGADGVHLPSDGLPTAEVRRLAQRLHGPLLIGRSTHAPEEVARARDEGADFVVFGPVYPTPGKERFGAPPGLRGLRAAVGPGLPVLALGGVDSGRIEEVAAGGAYGVAAIRPFYDPAERERLIARARQTWGPRVVDSAPPR